MKLQGERWRALVSTVRLGNDEYRVVRPARRLKHAPLYEGPRGVEMSVDKEAARTFAMAWAFAMRSPRTLVHLPLRQTKYECGRHDRPLMDIVLLHHSLGFRLSRWKDVRAKLGEGRLHTVRCQGLEEPDYSRHHHRENRDLLRGDVVAGTVFVVGSRLAFRNEGHTLRWLVEDGPQYIHEYPQRHCCAEITENRSHWEWLHVVYCDDHRVTSPS